MLCVLKQKAHMKEIEHHKKFCLSLADYSQNFITSSFVNK